jgi:hypothetical protein
MKCGLVENRSEESKGHDADRRKMKRKENAKKD